MKFDRREIYNQAINLFWTALSFIPIFLLWYGNYNWVSFSAALLISLVPFFLPVRFFIFLQISKDRKMFEFLGIKFFQAFAQNGRIVNKILRKQNSNFNDSKIRETARRPESQIVIYEQYYLSCFLFFIISLVYAILKNEILLAILLCAANLIYNIIPLLIQQYNKIRIEKLKR